MKKSFGALTAIAALVVLSGCSAPEPKAPVESAELPTASATTAPKVMSLKAGADETAVSAARPSADESFYFKTFDLWKSEGRDLPNDQELLKLGYKYCEKLDDGAKRMSVVVIEGKSEDAVSLNNYLGSSAVSALCTEYL